jgi:hypothetical protein
VYQSVFLTKFSYVLPQCYFTSNQLKKIESKAQQAFTAKSGYNRKMSLAIRYGPISLGGAGFVQLSTIQGEGQLTNFLKHWRSDTYVSSLLRCSLAWAQMNSGISVPLLMVPSISIPHLESIFLKSTRDFLSQIDGQIEVDDPFIPPAQREHDEYLMDIALASPEFTSSDLRVLNYCRLYLQAVTMADIATAHGDALDSALVLGGSSPTSSSSNYCHTNQELPTPPSWKIWLRLCNLIEAKLSHQPLGQWLLPAPQLRRDWPYYYDHSSSALYVRSATQFEQFHSTDGVSFSDGTLCDWIVTATSVPVGVSLLDDWSEYSLLLPIPWAHVLPTPSIPASFPDYLHELPLAGDRLLFESLELRVPLDELIATLDATATSRNPSTRCHGVSDGTEDNSCMSFAWVLAGPDGRRLAQCASPAFGSQASSYRAEGYGVVSLVKFLSFLKRFCLSGRSWRVKIGADNESFITKVNQAMAYETPFPNVTMDPDYDLIAEVVQTVRLSTLAVSFVHVLGHQDSRTDFDDLDLPSQLNVEADRLAGVFRQAHPSPNPYVPRLSTNRAQLHLSGNSITRKYRSAIRYQKTAPTLEAYMTKKFNWAPEVVDLVDWPSFRRARNRLNSRHVQICKLCFDQLPTASVVSRWDPTTPKTCPRCQQADESFAHLFQCVSPAVLSWRSQVLHDLRKHCVDQWNSRYGLVEVLCAGLECWFQGDLSLDPDQFPPTLRPLIHQQNQIGWDQLFRGRMSLLWAELQHAQVQDNPHRHVSDTGTKWVTNVLCFLWERFFVLWKSRNEVVFGSNISESRQSTVQKVLAQLRDLHSHRAQYRPCDVSFLMSPTATDEDRTFKDTIRRQGVSRVQDWLETWKPYFRKSLQKAAAATSTASTRRISDHFPVLRRPHFRSRSQPPTSPTRRRRPRVGQSPFRAISDYFRPPST